VKLRNALRESLKDTCAQGELPTLDAIHKTKIPYLDAFLEEMTRLSHTSMSNGRITTQDVEVLGHHIPKGIEVWLMVSRHFFNNTLLIHVHRRTSVQDRQLHPSTSQTAAAEAEKHTSRRGRALGTRTAWPNSCLSDGFAGVKMARMCSTHKLVQITPLGLAQEDVLVSSNGRPCDTR
jgi:hypothetical protein